MFSFRNLTRYILNIDSSFYPQAKYLIEWSEDGTRVSVLINPQLPQIAQIIYKDI